MREIKFRAWHDGNMVYWGLFRNDDTYLLDTEITIDEDKDSIMQYTGLKDRNDKEIYEGDIIQWWNKVTKPQVVEATDGGWNPFIDDCQTDGSWHYEVIGNIHENKKLMRS